MKNIIWYTLKMKLKIANQSGNDDDDADWRC